MQLHSVLVSYNRAQLTERAIESYLDTVTVEHTLIVVDNGSDAKTERWLMDGSWKRDNDHHFALLLGENRYPGYACNRGFELASPGATHFHRADNDFIFLPGWSEHVKRRFELLKDLGQLGLRTDEEELYAPWNVGGNMVVRRELWDAGLRYDERPWTEFPPGYTEDSFLTPEVVKMGWEWGRVKQSCIQPTSSEDPNDEYYQQTWADRRISPSV